MNAAKKALALLLCLLMVLSLAACGGTAANSAGNQDSAPAADDTAPPVALDKDAYDALVASGPTASEEEIAQSAWASAVREAGVLRVGTTPTSYLFSQLDETDGVFRGFDAGLYEMLANYILGDPSKWEMTQVDSSTRETVLQDGQVDAVFATYSITEERAKLVSFAGPYYTSRSAILVLANSSEVGGLDDLSGKLVATQAGSTGPSLLAQYAPKAEVQEFSTDQEARAALEQGRVDAYVTDYTLLLNAMVKNPGAYQLAGEVFGPEDNYGIGLPLDSDGVAFVNQYLQKLEEHGLWEELWQITIGRRAGVSETPAAPELPQ